MAKKPADAGQVKVRMPKDLQRKIQREADRRGQTINAEILRRLELSFEHESERQTIEDMLKRVESAVRNTADSLKQVAVRMDRPPPQFVAWLAQRLNRPTEEVLQTLSEYYEGLRESEKPAESKSRDKS